MKPKCQSHYVRIDSSGFVFSKPRDKSYDEIVLAQENLIVPAYLLEMDQKDIIAMQQRLGFKEVELEHQVDPPVIRTGSSNFTKEDPAIRSGSLNFTKGVKSISKKLDVTVNVKDIMNPPDQLSLLHDNEDPTEYQLYDQ